MVRILIVARPADGRPVETVLREAGHEVHRTPVDADLGSLVSRLRPDLLIVALNIPWGDGFEAVQPLIAGSWPGSILLLVGTGRNDRILDLPHVPLGVEPGELLRAVNRLLAVPDRPRED